jgi:hypothetical protein
MDDDPNDLAAAFFASQSAREEARATLPIDDWTRAIVEVVGGVDGATAAGVGFRGVVGGADNDDVATIIQSTYTKWLVSTMPPAPTCRAADDDWGVGMGGIVGIALNPDDARLFRDSDSRGTPHFDGDVDGDGGVLLLTPEEIDMRRMIKDRLVRSLEGAMMSREREMRNNASSN